MGKRLTLSLRKSERKSLMYKIFKQVESGTFGGQKKRISRSVKEEAEYKRVLCQAPDPHFPEQAISRSLYKNIR